MKSFQKTKTIENQGRQRAEDLQSFNPKQQLKSIIDLFLKNLLNTEAKDEIDKIKTIVQEII